MAFTYKYIDPPQSPEKAIDFLQHTLVPLLHEYWESEGKKIYNCEMYFNVLTFVQIWNMGSMAIIIAYDGDKPAGFMLGVKFTPIMYNANALHTELLYAPTPEIRTGILNYLYTIVRFMDINEVWVRDGGDTPPPDGWRTEHMQPVVRLIKE